CTAALVAKRFRHAGVAAAGSARASASARSSPTPWPRARLLQVFSRSADGPTGRPDQRMLGQAARNLAQKLQRTVLLIAAVAPERAVGVAPPLITRPADASAMCPHRGYSLTTVVVATRLVRAA